LSAQISQTVVKPSSRLVSVDLMRGLTVAFMILVNNNGNNDLAYRGMNHSPWNGFTPTDLVFPTFLLIMGVSMVLSWGRHKAKNEAKSTFLLHVAKRTLLLFLLGLVVNGFPYFHLGTLRIYGVLQRIAVCYVLASLLQLITKKVTVKVGLLFALLMGYWVLLRYVPVPGYGHPVQSFPLLDKDLNLVAYIDRHIFPHRLFEQTRDPEGLLSDLPAFASTLLGLITGDWLLRVRSQRSIVLGLLTGAVVALASGWLWSFTFPINKKLWTSSYVLYAGGWSLLILAACYYLVEVRGWRGRWLIPWLVFGTNAITAYVFSELMSSAVAVFHRDAAFSYQQWIYGNFFQQIFNPAFGSLLYSIAFVIVCWLVVYVLYRRRIFIKL
jgi:predicted acyltransferase